MKTVLVTGASGFVGKNLCAQLEQDPELTVLRFSKENSDAELSEFVAKADFVFHLAGVNRPKEEIEFEQGNKELTEHLVQLLSDDGRKVPLLVSSSIQVDLDNPYGRSKKAAEDTVLAYGRDTGASAFVYRLPNLFGKWGRVEYNSVVATFCHNISRGLPVTMSDPSYQVTLAYIDNVVEEFIGAMNGQAAVDGEGICHIPVTYTVSLQQLKDTLTSFHDSRVSLVMPSLESDFNRYLYASFTSYFETDNFSYELKTNTDERGWLAEFIKSKQFGQIFVSKTKPGVSRGNHWHNTKIEKFLVVDGEAEISFRKVDGDEAIRYNVSGEKLTVLDIPAGYVHAIKNTGQNDLTTIFWADEILNPEKPDTIYASVEKETETQ